MTQCTRWSALVAFSLVAAGALAQQAAPVRVCLPEDSEPYSTLQQGQPRGLDVAILQAAVQRLGRAFQPVWFESRYDSQGNDSLDARALLAANACDLVAGVPLYEPHLAPMIAEKARTPDYPGAQPLRQRPWQTLVPVTGRAPYRASALTLIAREPNDAAVAALESLRGRSVAVRAGSMAALALAGWRSGALASSIRGYNLRDDLLGAVAAGRADFALVDIAVWDRYRAAHPQTALSRTAFEHPLKINIGVLARSTDEPLLRDVETAVVAARAAEEIAAMASAAGATWIAPVAPVVRPTLSLRDFLSAGG
ncbi:substrate-binding periplasmic protein [Rhizobacter fulvus]